MLVVGHRSFHAFQPYAETGPLFLCANPCTRYPEDGDFPDALTNNPDFILRGYGHDNRIVCGTGTIVPTPEIPARAADAVVTDVEVAGQRAVAIQADTGKPDDVIRLFAEADAAFGQLDAFVNNAGIVNPIGRLDSRDPADLECLVAVNLTGAILVCAEAVRRMSTRHGGQGGLDSLTVGLAQEVTGEGIRVNAVRPGIVDTDIHDDLGDEPGRVERLGKNVPAGRQGTAAEVAETIVWLCSDAASYVSMSLMEVSGAR